MKNNQRAKTLHYCHFVDRCTVTSKQKSPAALGLIKDFSTLQYIYSLYCTVQYNVLMYVVHICGRRFPNNTTIGASIPLQSFQA